MNSGAYLRWLLTVAAIFLALANCSPVRGQDATTCDENKPFTAQTFEHVVSTQPDGKERRIEISGFRARDGSGRIYVQTTRNHGSSPPVKLVSGNGKKTPVTSLVVISDCHTGKEITLFPDVKKARIGNAVALSWKRERGASLYEFLAGGPRPSNVTIDDLGFKDIEGFAAHGYRETIIGTGDDAEWSGRTRFVMETWISDELVEIVLRTITNYKIGSTTTDGLTAIKSVEPPRALFEIPEGYTIEPVKEFQAGPDAR